jgi:hypothetical protein
VKTVFGTSVFGYVEAGRVLRGILGKNHIAMN